MKSWIVDVITLDWRLLRPFIDNNYVSRVFIWIFLLPVAANIASKLPEQITLSSSLLSESIDIQFTLPFTWYILYFSAVSFSVSRLIFLKFCPSFVKLFRDAGDAMTRGVTAQMYSSDFGEEIIKHIGSKGELSELERSSINRFLRQLDLNPSNDAFHFVHPSMKKSFAKRFRECLARVKLTESINKPGYYSFENRSYNILMSREQLLKHLWWDLDRILKRTHLGERIACAFFAYLGYGLLTLVFLQSALWVICSL